MAGDAPSFMEQSGTTYSLTQTRERCSTLPTELWRGIRYSVSGGSAMAYGVLFVGVMFVTLIIIVVLLGVDSTQTRQQQALKQKQKNTKKVS